MTSHAYMTKKKERKKKKKTPYDVASRSSSLPWGPDQPAATSINIILEHQQKKKDGFVCHYCMVCISKKKGTDSYLPVDPGVDEVGGLTWTAFACET